MNGQSIFYIYTAEYVSQQINTFQHHHALELSVRKQATSVTPSAKGQIYTADNQDEVSLFDISRPLFIVSDIVAQWVFVLIQK